MMKRISNGFTLIEVLVVVAVIGILMALLIPAVQSSRSASRALSCSDHLKQIGIAVSNFETARGTYPAGAMPNRSIDPLIPDSIAELSVHFQILPYLDQSNLYNAANLPLPPKMGGNYTTATWPIDACNFTVAQTSVEVYLCPEDERRLKPGNSYRGCVGAYPYSGESNKIPFGGGGAFPRHIVWLNPSGFTDGLSSTVGFSERVEGGGDSRRFNHQRDAWMSYLTAMKPPEDSDEMNTVCESIGNETPQYFYAFLGSGWIRGSFTDTLYNHDAPPNWIGPDCSSEGRLINPLDEIGGGTISARSRHPGGVHVLLMDGSVHFVKQSINLKVWRAIATRAGGEVVDSSSF